MMSCTGLFFLIANVISTNVIQTQSSICREFDIDIVSNSFCDSLEEEGGGVRLGMRADDPGAGELTAFYPGLGYMFAQYVGLYSTNGKCEIEGREMEYRVQVSGELTGRLAKAIYLARKIETLEYGQ